MVIFLLVYLVCFIDELMVEINFVEYMLVYFIYKRFIFIWEVLNQMYYYWLMQISIVKFVY